MHVPAPKQKPVRNVVLVRGPLSTKPSSASRFRRWYRMLAVDFPITPPVQPLDNLYDSASSHFPHIITPCAYHLHLHNRMSSALSHTINEVWHPVTKHRGAASSVDVKIVNRSPRDPNFEYTHNVSHGNQFISQSTGKFSVCDTRPFFQRVLQG
jgi:hypothetical protein